MTINEWPLLNAAANKEKQFAATDNKCIYIETKNGVITWASLTRTDANDYNRLGGTAQAYILKKYADCGAGKLKEQRIYREALEKIIEVSPNTGEDCAFLIAWRALNPESGNCD